MGDPRKDFELTGRRYQLESMKYEEAVWQGKLPQMLALLVPLCLFVLGAPLAVLGWQQTLLVSSANCLDTFYNDGSRGASCDLATEPVATWIAAGLLGLVGMVALCWLLYWVLMGHRYEARDRQEHPDQDDPRWSLSRVLMAYCLALALMAALTWVCHSWTMTTTPPSLAPYNLPTPTPMAASMQLGWLSGWAAAVALAADMILTLVLAVALLRAAVERLSSRPDDGWR